MKPPFNVTILGSSSALPTAYRMPTSQLVQFNNQYFLIDCGEGTQMQLRKLKLPMNKINHIFISHLHGDHIFGLPGLLSTYSLLGRKQTLNIYAPSELQRFMQLHSEVLKDELGYEVKYHPLSFKNVRPLMESKEIEVTSIPLRHKTNCCAFVFQERQRDRNLKKEMIEFYEIPIAYMQSIKQGEDYITAEGKTIPNSRLTTPPPAIRKYVFATDTAPCQLEKHEQVQGADLMYHEATFAQTEKDLAKATGHSTAKEAAYIAKNSAVKKLLIGHFSSRYKKIDALEKEAKKIFPNTTAVNDGERFVIE